MIHSSAPCAERAQRGDGCPISLLCGCACHHLGEDGPDEELTPRDRAELVLGGSLSALLNLYPNQPVRITRLLLESLERNGLRIEAAA